MRTAAAFAVLVVAAATAMAPSSAQGDADFDKITIKVTPVAQGIYMLQGAGGNIAASVGQDGIVIVDDQYAPLAGKIRAALSGLGITDKPVRYVINTHYHGDHTGGNAPMSTTATVIAHDNVRTRLAAGGPAGNGGSVHIDNDPAQPAALPVITFDHDLTVHLNGETIRALHLPAGHTDGDVVVFFPQANVVHMGDDFVRYGFPFIDVEAGGSVQGMIDADKAVLAQVPPDVKVIPGHGDLSGVEDVRAFVEMLEATSAAVSKARAAGKSLEQMKQDKVLEPWESWSGDFISTDAFIETLYASLGGDEGGGFRRHD